MSRMDQEEQDYRTGIETKVQELEANGNYLIQRIFYFCFITAGIDTDSPEYQSLYSDLSILSADQPESFHTPVIEAVSAIAGEEAGAIIQYISTHMTEYPYAQGFYRRPFRTRTNATNLAHMLFKIKILLRAQANHFSLQDYLTKPDYQSERLHWFSNIIPDWIAYELDCGQGWAEVALKEIIYGENQTALLKRAMIQGILMSHRMDLYEMIGNLLVAARLQEGLRQSITEVMDTCTLQASLYLMRIILDYDLIRYSSVVRALGTWTGMGLEAANQRVAGQLMEQAYKALTDEEQRIAWISSKNANQIYLSLWATAVIEEEDLLDRIQYLMKQGELYQKIVAQYVLANSQNESVRFEIARLCLNESDPELLYWIIRNYSFDYEYAWVENVESRERILSINRMPALDDKQVRKVEFENFKAILRVPVKEKSGQSGVLDFIQFDYQVDQVLRKMMYLTAYDMDEEWIEDLIEFSDLMSSSLRGDLINYFVSTPQSSAQRSFVFTSLSDKYVPNREIALLKMKRLHLNDTELIQVEDMLKLKTGSLRQNAIRILLEQPEAKLNNCLIRLLDAKGELQRLAGLELLTELNQDPKRESQYENLRHLTSKISTPTPKEKQMLEKLNQQFSYTVENGFGLFNPEETEEWLLEKTDNSNVSNEQIFPLTFERASAFLSGLDELIHEWRNTEYETEFYGRKETVLLGVRLQTLTYEGYSNPNPIYNDNFEMESKLNNYPLSELWHNYLINSGLNSQELMQLYYCMDYDTMIQTKLIGNEQKKNLELMFPLKVIQKIQNLYSRLHYSHQVKTLVNAYFMDSERSDAFEIANQALIKRIVNGVNELSTMDKPIIFILTYPWLSILRSRVYNEDTFRSFFRTAYQYDVLKQRIKESEYSVLQWDEYIRAYTLNIINDNELCKYLLIRDIRTNMRNLTSPQDFLMNNNAKWIALRERIVARLLDIELARGDLKTAASVYTMSFGRIEGMEYFIRILTSLGGETFIRGYIYGYSNDHINKKDSLSHLLKICYPLESDDELKLEQILHGTGITERHLLEAAMYAPQWIDIIAKHLNWEGLRSAAWYFHAHVNETFSAEKETIVAHYSPITPEEFNDGAFDVKWFKEAYCALGEKRFKLLYDCAKYISVGANHRRSQLFADAVLGQLQLEEMKLSVADKRNKEHLLAYSLIPLDPIQENDLRERFEFIQLFLKQSQGYGAQRRASEAIMSAIAFDNLARSAGYADVTRLTWDMEARKLENLGMLFEPHPLDEVTNVRLTIDEFGNTEVEFTSKGKTLKSVPARFKKDNYVVELKEVKSDLTEQYRRAKRELERSMVEEICFTVRELSAIYKNPIIEPLLRTLVFKVGDQLGYFLITSDNLKSLKEPSGSTYELSDPDEITIAHPFHLYESGQWSKYQQDLFDNGIRQPFKQVFRELYLTNSDEQSGIMSSRRYAGYQVQPRKTVALLRGRGWTVSYEDGLQKVSFQKNVITTLYAMADWFSPADTEAPTLETLEFIDRTTYTPIPLDKISSILFSETMRDIDLVISSAHVGGVDPEASLTTIELRNVIVRESMRLLKLDNVKLEGNYALIDGKLGEYAVHLGSGIAFKQGSGALNIIPVHSQHRGRIFLPFLDEDPRTAEVLSKVVLLAEDHKIKDPQILVQL